MSDPRTGPSSAWSLQLVLVKLIPGDHRNASSPFHPSISPPLLDPLQCSLSHFLSSIVSIGQLPILSHPSSCRATTEPCPVRCFSAAIDLLHMLAC